MTMKSSALAGILTIATLALAAFAQEAPKPSITVTKGPIVLQEVTHDTGPLLREVAPLLPEFSIPAEHEIENNVNPNHNWVNRVERDEVLQTQENSPGLQSPNFGVEFDGAGFGDSFFCDCMPPDNDGAPGTTQYVQYINGEYQVFDKSGNTVLGPLAGNTFWSGFNGSCAIDDDGDPIVRFDAAAQRWVVSQFAISSTPFAECVAVSTTADATGSYNRYQFSFSDFPDYPKMGVWPDAYYFTFNNFNGAGTSYIGANVCAANRTKMLAGATATIQCFQLDDNQYGMLPSDLDGAVAPPAGTPNFVMELDPSGAAKLDMYKFHVDFTTPANSTLTGPTAISVAAFTPLCNPQYRGRCVPQPSVGSDMLESLGDRLMYRLVYRNFGDHSTLLTTHSIVAGSSGGVRWYEIRNPETTPTVFQSGTFAPDSQYRWMPAIAMDQDQDIAVGFSRSGTGAGQYPALVYAGRVPTDAAGTLESEVVMKAGAGSQTENDDRWGDYSSLTIDPTDDCTFWFSEEYEKADGGFNWSTAIGSFKFPGCTATPSFYLSPASNSVAVAQGSNATDTITITPVNGFSGSVTFSATGLPTGVTAAFTPNPATSTSTLTLTASAAAATGTSTVTIKGVSGALTQSTTVSLTVNASATADFSLSAAPTSVTIAQGNNGTSTITVNPIAGFSGSVTLSATGLPSGVTKTFSPNPTASTSTLTFTAAANATTGTVTVTVKGVSGSLSHTTTLSLTVNTSGGTPAVTLSPTSETWGSIVVGVETPAKLVTLTNSGTGTLNISSIATNGDFALATSSKPCGSTLAAGLNCKIAVTFTPTQAGTRSGNITFIDNAAGSPQTVALSGTGVNQATLTPVSATYAAQKVGTTSAARVFTLTNKQPMALTGIAVSTTGDFNVSTTTCTASLAAKGTCKISVVFSPTAVGSRTGTVKVTDGANNSPQVSNLTGTGK